MIATNVNLVHFLLFLHILAALVAFGPAFVFPLILGMARKEPQHMAFAATIVHTISSKVTRIGAIAAGILGLLLIPVGGWDLKSNWWLVVSLLIYVIAIVFSVVVQGPNSEKMVELLSSATPGEAPPAEVPELAKHLQMGGTTLGVAIIALVLLMVFKPGS